jgi:O-antigen ligase
MPVIQGSRWQRALVALSLVFVVTLGATAGSSRDDVFIFLFTQVAAVLLLGALLLPATRQELRTAGAPLVFLLALTGIMVAQLVPLPPSIWANLPGREFYVTASEAASVSQPWRPLSLSPDRTADSLLALLPILATVLVMSLTPPRFAQTAVMALLGLAIASSVLAAFQVSAGSGALRIYRFTSPDSGVGLLANRNHQATLLAMAIPAVAWWMARPPSVRVGPQIRIGLGIAMLLLFLVGALLTGSRMGLLICGVSLVGAAALAWPTLRRIRSAVLYPAVGATVLLGLVGAWFTLSNHRAIEETALSDPRFTIWPRTLDMIGEFLPFGAGIGTYDRVYPRFEQLADLVPEYTNRAHNDFLEIGAEAGIFAYLLLSVFLSWFASAALKVWRAPLGVVHDMGLARLCSVIVVIGLAASLTDYPLRTSLLACIFTAACIPLHRVARDIAGRTR